MHACKTQPKGIARAKKSTQTFLYRVFREPFGSCMSAPKILDVRTKKRVFSAAPVMGRNFLTQGHPGVRVRNVRRKSGPKRLCLHPIRNYLPKEFEKLKIGIGIGKFPITNSQELHIGKFLTGQIGIGIGKFSPDYDWVRKPYLINSHTI